MSDKKFYITTPLYYVNAKPHIGHAYTNVLCDTFTRYFRLIGKDVFYLTGTDEHGTKIEKTAKDNDCEPRAYVDEMVPHFKELWKILGIEYDYFIRTTDDAHRQVVQNVLRDLEKKGEIYKAEYTGWYCTPCESFWTALQLKESKCPDCGRDVNELSEQNYFFKLSKYQEWLVDYIQSHPDFVRPEMRRNEILSFLKEPLTDLCITRPRTRLRWGIPYPDSEDHVIYVWFDALLNYVSAIGYTTGDEQFQTHWPADLQIVGKDILRQHAVYWPIMLKACGLPMPETVLAHGWWTMSGAKVSKSRGNIVDPIELVRIYGVDPFRYFLLREVTIGFDGAYSEDLLRERYTSDLANDLGNLWFRLASMIGRYFEGKLPEAEPDSKIELVGMTAALWEKVHAPMSAFDPRTSLDEIWKVVTRANQFVEEKKPWVLAKDPERKGELAETMVILTEAVAHVAVLLQAFLPHTAAQILNRLQIADALSVPDAASFQRRLVPAGTQVDRGEPLFPKLEDEEKS